MSVVEHGYLIGVSRRDWMEWAFNGQVLEDCKDYKLVAVLNYLGQDEWEFAGMIGKDEYILKRK